MVRVCNIFNDNMILQANKKLKIWGKTDENKLEIYIKNERNESFKPLNIEINKGEFIANFPIFSPSYERYTIILNNKNIAENVVFGDVFIAIGQSNMDYSVASTNCLEEVQKRNWNNDEFFRVMLLSDEYNEKGEFVRSGSELFDVKFPTWHILNSESLKRISAVGYMAIKKIKEEKNYPMGIYHMAVGGSPIDSWLGEESYEKDSRLVPFIRKRYSWYKKEEYETFVNPKTRPSIYKEKIAPIKNISLKGAIWYQGENSSANCYEAKFFKICLERLILDYRLLFQDDFHFHLVHIAPFLYFPDAYSVNYINEAIQDLTKKLKFISQTPIYDIYPFWLRETKETYYHPIHPIVKTEVGDRVGKILFSELYLLDKKNKCPEIIKIIYQNNVAILKYKNTYDGLKTSDGKYLKGFATSDGGKFYPCKAEIISENEVKLTSDNVIKYITYAFYLYNMDSNLVNSQNIPALIYRNKRGKARDFYDYQVFLSCDKLKAWECNYFPEFGNTGFCEAYSLGEASKNLKISIDNGIRLDYKEDNSSLYLFSVKFNSNISGYESIFKKYKGMKITLSAKNACEFYGIKFTSSNNIRMMFKAGVCPEKFESEKEFEINFDKVRLADYREIALSKKDYDNIFNTEFLFRSLKDNVVIIKEIKLI